MLVLTRKRSEMIQIGEDIIIKVIEMGPRWVKIGVDAPENVRVIRTELFGKTGASQPLQAFVRQRQPQKPKASGQRKPVATADGRQSRVDGRQLEVNPHVAPGASATESP